MWRILLTSLIFVLIFATLFGVSVSLGPGLSIKNVYLYLILILIAIREVVEPRRAGVLGQVVPLVNLQVLFVLLIAYGCISWLVMVILPIIENYNPVRGLITLKGYLIEYYLVFLAFFFAIRTREDIVATLRAMLIMIIVANVLTALDAFEIIDLGLVDGAKDKQNWGPMGNANQYGTFLIFFIPSFVALASGSSIRDRTVFGFGAAISIVMLVATLSRGAYVGLVLGGVLSLWFLRHEVKVGKSLQRYAAIGVVILLLALATGQWEAFYDRTVGLTTKAANAEELSSGRIGIWSDVIEDLMSHPLGLIIGMGWDSYDQSRQFRLSTHNTYLLYLYELGIIGLLLYVALMRQIVVEALRMLSRASGVERTLLVGFIFGFLGLIVATFFGNLYVPWIFILAYTGLSLRLAQLLGVEKIG